MKYAIIIPAGAVDRPLDELSGRTPLEAANLPALDELAKIGRIGTAVTIPAPLPPLGEVGILSVLGFDPREFPPARARFEALGRGLELGRDDQVFRCNLVTVTDGVLRDFAAGYLSSAEAERLIATLDADLGDGPARLHPIRAHRSLLVWKEAGRLPKLKTTAPDQIVDQPVKRHFPRGRGSDPLRSLIRRSQVLLAEHEVNVVRRDLGENPANCLWPYGQGPMPALPMFSARYGPRGAVVAGTDLVRGIGRRLGWRIIDVPTATGLLDTDYAAKGRAAAAALDSFDLVCVHVEAPDEAGHRGNAAEKVRVLENIDRQIVVPLVERLHAEREWRALVIVDHATPVPVRSHTTDPTIFVMAGTGIESNRGEAFDEPNADMGEVHVDPAWGLMEYFLRR